MKQYINRRQIKYFKKSIRKIRSAIGKENISNMDKTYGVDGSTLRAYKNYKIPPKHVYREWAKYQTQLIIGRQPTNSITTEDDFQIWHTSLFKSLNQHWKNKQGCCLPLSHCYKLIDLYVKWLSKYSFSDPCFVENLNKFGSCALDSKTLTRINLCYCNFLPINKPRMGNIHNKNTYDYCQKLISEFCLRANATKLEFDYWAWTKGG